MRPPTLPARGRGIVGGGLLFGVAVAAAAQQDTAPVVKIAKIEIAGSSVARIDGETGCRCR